VSGNIFLLHGEDELVPMAETPYDSEDVLQALLARFPDLLAGDQLEGQVPRRWLLVGREAALPTEEDGGGRWSVDHLFLDQDAVPTLVEVKRSSDTRIRREVIGQMVDYAANAVVYWPIDTLRSVFERRCEREGLDSGIEHATVLEADADSDADAFWEQAGANLKAGRIRLVFVADEIPSELRRVVEFLNEQMTAEVLAIEVRQYVGEGVRTLVPRVIGQTAAAETRKGRREQRQWDEQSFFAELQAKRGAADVRMARVLLEWARVQSLRVRWGAGKVEGSFSPGLDHAGRTLSPISVFTNGRFEIPFSRLRDRPPFDDPELRRDFLRRINEIPGVALSDTALAGTPSISFSQLTADATWLQPLKDALDWFCETVRAQP
jgi:hypothetical protein